MKHFRRMAHVAAVAPRCWPWPRAEAPAPSSGNSGGGASSGGGSSGGGGKSPITIGTSLSMSGDFAADGQAFQKGYQLWVADENAHGGLLGHHIKLEVVSHASSPSQVVTNYQKLIGSNHDLLLFAQAAQATHSLDNSKIMSYLHGGVTLNSVQGAVKLESLGENAAGQTLTFQWQNGKLVQTIPTTTPVPRRARRALEDPRQGPRRDGARRRLGRGLPLRRPRRTSRRRRSSPS